MPVLTRFTVDLVTEEQLSERRVEVISREMTDNLHIILTEAEDEAYDQVNKHSYGHVHDTADGSTCPSCAENARDYRNGDRVAEGDF